MFCVYELRKEDLTSLKTTVGYPVSRPEFGRGASRIEAQNTVAIPVRKLITYMSTVLNIAGLDWPRGFQEVKVPRFHDNGTGWW
jgi:hypothetical protein